jgi:hypothetical protein
MLVVLFEQTEMKGMQHAIVSMYIFLTRPSLIQERECSIKKLCFALSRMTPSIMILSTDTLSILTISILTLRITTLSILTLLSDTQYDNIHHYGTQHNEAQNIANQLKDSHHNDT